MEGREMTLAICFYVLMLLALLGYGFVNRGRLGDAWPGFVVWLLLLCLGWAVFGPPIKG